MDGVNQPGSCRGRRAMDDDGNLYFVSNRSYGLDPVDRLHAESSLPVR